MYLIKTATCYNMFVAWKITDARGLMFSRPPTMLGVFLWFECSWNVYMAYSPVDHRWNLQLVMCGVINCRTIIYRQKIPRCRYFSMSFSLCVIRLSNHVLHELIFPESCIKTVTSNTAVFLIPVYGASLDATVLMMRSRHCAVLVY